MAAHAHSTPLHPHGKPSAGAGRRRLLSAVPALLVAPAAGAAPSPDAGLLRSCATYACLEREFAAVDFDCPPGTPAAQAADEARDRILAAQWEHVERICARPPSTPAGFAALAATVALLDPELAATGSAEGLVTNRLVATLLRGLGASASDAAVS